MEQFYEDLIDAMEGRTYRPGWTCWQGFRCVDPTRIYYEDTGRTDFTLYEYLL